MSHRHLKNSLSRKNSDWHPCHYTDIHSHHPYLPMCSRLLTLLLKSKTWTSCLTFPSHTWPLHIHLVTNLPPEHLWNSSTSLHFYCYFQGCPKLRSWQFGLQLWADLLCLVLMGWTWTSYLSLESLSLLTYKMRIMTTMPTSELLGNLNEAIHVKVVKSSPKAMKYSINLDCHNHLLFGR